MPETPDFDQIALDLVEELLDAVGHDFIRPDGQSKAQSQIAVAAQLRHVWNARCAIAAAETRARSVDASLAVSQAYELGHTTGWNARGAADLQVMDTAQSQHVPVPTHLVSAIRTLDR